MNEVTLSLMSGLAGAIIGAVIIIIFTNFRDNRENKLSLARDKLEKVYGPLVALKKKIDLVNGGGFFIPRTKIEKKMVEQIVFNYYHLVDDDLKEDIILLYPEASEQDTNKVKIIQSEIEEKIIKHYQENKEILGIK